jgi:hypothetical protein
MTSQIQTAVLTDNLFDLLLGSHVDLAGRCCAPSFLNIGLHLKQLVLRPTG